MKERIHFVFPALLILLVISACKLTITATTGPPLASTLSVITITVTGSAEAESEPAPTVTEHGLVMQIPQSWQAISATAEYSSQTCVLSPRPIYQALYTAEPNYKVLVGGTGGCTDYNLDTSGTVTVKLLVGDFDGAFGDTRSYTLKFAAGVFCRDPDGPEGEEECQWWTDDPEGEFDFSNITQDKYVHEITVQKLRITADERKALTELYDSTNGDDWTDNSGWKDPPLDTVDGFAMPGTEESWQGVTLGIHPDTVNTTVLELRLSGNNLVGTLPVELGNLSNLEALSLDGNQISGGIPPQLGNLTDLTSLYLNSNKLTGEIPTTLTNLTELTTAAPPFVSPTTDIGYNALYTDDDALRTFLNNKDPDWEMTQTVAPEDVVASSLSTTSIELSWTPILYTADSGSYHVYSATAPGGPFSFYGQTSSKTDSSLTVEGLTSGTTYYFYVETVTDPHPNNLNTVISERSLILQLRTPMLMPWLPLLLFGG